MRPQPFPESKMTPAAALSRPSVAEIADILRSVIGNPDIEVTEATTWDEVPGWDSMNHISLLVETECRFGIEFQSAEIDGLRDVGALVRTIQAKLAAQ